MKTFRCFICCVLFAAALPSTGLAEVPEENSSGNQTYGVITTTENSAGNRHEISIGGGGTMSTTPYRNYATQWAGYPIISYEGPYAYIRGFKGGIKLVNLEFLELSAYGGYDGTSFEASDSSNRTLRRLKDRHESAVAGAEVQLKTPYGMLHASGEGDVLGHSNGFSGAFGYMTAIDFGPLEFVPSVGANWSSKNYNDYYYGISEKESRRSGLDDYSAGGGISPYVGLTLDYSITDALEIFCNGQVMFLSDAIKDSPMVSRDTTHSVTMGLTYTFGVGD